MQYINKFLRCLKPYPLASHKIWTVPGEERKKMLKLDWNESTLPPSPHVIERIFELASQPDFYNIYPSTNNERLAELLSDYAGLPKENILYFSGSDVAQECIARVFLSPGDPVLLLGPTYDNFRLTAEVSGANVHIFEFNEDFTFSAKRFESAIEELHPTFVYICSPNNPTGYRHSIEYLDHLLSRYSETMFLIDEAYYEFSNLTVKDLMHVYTNLLISRTMSKAFALANFRFGYVLSAKENIDIIRVVRNPKNIPTFTQTAAMGALEDTQYMRDYVNTVCKARDEFYQNLCSLDSKKIQAYESFGNFILVKLSTIEIRNGLIAHLTKNNIFIRPMHQSLLLDTCLRISIGTSTQMDYVFNTIKNFIDIG